MRVFLENVDLSSFSGPNGFGRKLIKHLFKMGCDIMTFDGRNSGIVNSVFVSDDLQSVKTTQRNGFDPNIQLAFIASYFSNSRIPMIQRIDGIYFNISQNWKQLNDPLRRTYDSSDAVIFQSNFNRQLVERYFGEHGLYRVIGNGTDFDVIQGIDSFNSSVLDKFESVWLCASSWRPHKRLNENIRYFLENSSKKDCLIVCGENPDCNISFSRIFYMGHSSWRDLISLMKRSKYFLHLEWIPHCPNVVVDARACGCHIICSSTGGAREIAGKNSTMIVEDVWDFSPINLYSPPKMDFTRRETCQEENSIDIKDCAKKYFELMCEVVS